MNILLYKLNNYCNRQVYKCNTGTNMSSMQHISQVPGAKSITTITNINFVESDGINTKLTVNYDDKINQADYIFVYDNNGRICSRWFIIDCNKNKLNQYDLSLKRDLIADYYDDVMKSTTYIKKGYVDPNNIAIYNKEDITFNQIKTSETLLKDYIDCPWIVGYINIQNTEEQEIIQDIDLPISYNVTNLDSYKYSELIGKRSFSVDNIFYTVRSKLSGVSGGYNVEYSTLYPATLYYKRYLSKLSETGIGNIIKLDKSSLRQPNANDYFFLVNSELATSRKSDLTVLRECLEDGCIDPLAHFENEKVLVKIDSEDGKYIALNNGTDPVKYYRIKVTKSEAETYHPFGTVSNIGLEAACLNNLAASNVIKSTDNNNSVGKLFNANDITKDIDPKTIIREVTLEEVATFRSQDYKIKLTLNNDNAISLIDQPYKMFCMPFTNKYKIKVKNGGSILTLPLLSNLQLGIATSIASVGNLVSDIQLLPYCPLRDLIVDDENNIIDATAEGNYSVTIVNSILNNVESPLSALLFCNSSEFSFNIDYSEDLLRENMKIINECDTWRLCSPNYSGVFEFNMAKNWSKEKVKPVESFIVNCNYKPFTPYIHVAPVWGNLYGGNFNDARGLICGGDFSLPMIGDVFATYELNNKNYEQQFNRSIQTMELGTTLQATNNVIGTVSSLVTGKFASAAAGALNTANGLITNLNKIDEAKDQFGYNLGNIKAQPNTLSKVSAYNKNNKIYPFIEYYTCTDDEKKILRDKLKYNGMTVMQIGSITDYLNPDDETYIQGEIIRCSDISVDSKVLNEINNELRQGLHIMLY